jgi:peptidoglycan/xylan/chitin deacetylase (PgdA/CDA1 family)
MRAVSLLFHDVHRGDPGESGFVSAAANRYKLTLTDFDAQLAAVRGVRADAPILAANLIDGRLAGRQLPFLVTVDDGGVSYYTTIAERLEQRGWRGHCFVSTDFIGQRGFLSRDQIRTLAGRGHVIGSHSASHPARFSALPFGDMVSEWARSRQMLEDILGQSVDIASVPGGYFSSAVARAAREAGIRVLFTSEPMTRINASSDCVLIGRFAVRRGDPLDMSQRLVAEGSWARSLAWARWNAKGLVKPLLGPSYIRLADWLLTPRAPRRTPSRT